MATIAFREITKKYPGAARPAVDSVTFEVPEGSTCMLVGTSGSGKTTLLRMVNRLIEPTSGEIVIDGKNVLDENPIELRRRFGYVIQQVGLFPHMTIAENIRVTAEIAGGWDKGRLEKRTDELLDLVGLPPDEYRKRFPRQLSGGQQQRVGLARALTTDPAILLMDEPFGALDAITRARMQEELLRIQRDVHKTVLFVSHDIEEAFKLGDQIAVLSEGKLIQLGSPVELLANPANDFVRQLVGSDNMLRQLQYLPVADAIDHSADTPQGQDFPICEADTTLLQAMLKLLQTNALALLVHDQESDSTLGYVTLTSINQQITQVRQASSASPEQTAPSAVGVRVGARSNDAGRA
ncbi:MAG TPA: ATP-binding cassette domain-containing protein [Ktedonobacteraceae bacterium]|jgi:osmoprotectant transport system ATP-binding protein|nr:ATP-binding cassette domain-containing protein [Ktedonobacteraceae bacterium]